MSIFTATLPGGAALHLVISWVSRNVDEKDIEAVKRIVRHVLDHPEVALNNMKAIGGAAYAQISTGVSGADVQKLGVRTSAAGNPLLIGITAAGMVWGFLKSIYEAIEGVIDIIGDLEGFIDESLQLMEALLSSEGEEACREIGSEVGRSSATRLREIASENYLSAAFHIGELVGPVVVGAVLAYFTAGTGTAAMASTRFGQLLAKLRAIPKASKALKGLNKRAGLKRGVGAGDLDVDKIIDSIVEHPGNSPGPARRARPQRAATSHRTAAARQRFNSLREGYADRLGVQNGGQVHHAIELNVLDRYPGVFTESDLNSFPNMRGIGTELKNRRQLHNSKIREFWDRHYARMDQEIMSKGLRPGTEAYRRFVSDNLTEARREIDELLGQFFTEYRTGRPRSFD